MGRGALVLYRNTPENAEVAGDAGIPFDFAELAAKIELVLAMTRGGARGVAPQGDGARARSGTRGTR